MMIDIIPGRCSGGELAFAIFNTNPGSELMNVLLVFEAGDLKPASKSRLRVIVNQTMVGLSRKKHLAQAFADRIENGLEASGDLESPEDAVQMTFDCFLTDEEVLGDFFVGAACGKETQDLLLPRS